MQVTPYHKEVIKCLFCKGVGCSLCKEKHKVPGLKEKLLYQIDGIDYEVEKEIVAQTTKVVQAKEDS